MRREEVLIVEILNECRMNNNKKYIKMLCNNQIKKIQ